MANGSHGGADASRPEEAPPAPERQPPTPAGNGPSPAAASPVEAPQSPGPLWWPDDPISDGVVALDPMTEEDVPRLTAGASDPQTQRWLPLPWPYTEATARGFLADQAEAATAGRELAFAVRRAGQPELCGSMGLRLVGRHGEGEIGYWISPDARGQGLAAAGVRVLARWAIAELALHRVEMLVQPGNTASQRACQRAGAVAEGRRRCGLALEGQAVTDALVYSLVADDVADG